MNSHTIQEVHDARERLEQSILDVCRVFESKFGVEIAEDPRLERVRWKDDFGTRHGEIGSVSIQVLI